MIIHFKITASHLNLIRHIVFKTFKNIKHCSHLTSVLAFESNLRMGSMMVIIVNVCILWQRSKKNAHTDVKCEQGLIRIRII